MPSGRASRILAEEHGSAQKCAKKYIPLRKGHKPMVGECPTDSDMDEVYDN